MNPVIFLWAHPRSMSTAIERVMRERGDFDCLHEPFLHYFYLERSDKPLPHFESEAEHPTSYADTRTMILHHAETMPVFAKDMSYYVIPELLDDVGFCRRVRHCFLIRNPLRAILSYYRLDAAVSLGEIGIEAQWRHYEGLRKLGIDDSIVLEAEVVQQDSARAMGLFWQALELDYRAEALQWGRASTPADWEYVKGWHDSVTRSQGIRPTSTAREAQIEAEFAACCEKAPQLRDFLDHHLPYYSKLRQHSLGRGDDG